MTIPPRGSAPSSKRPNTRSRGPLTPAVLTSLLLAILLVVGALAAGFVAHERATSTSLAHGAAADPPWPAPTGAERHARADAAHLPNVYGAKLAEHIHTHLDITVDGRAEIVPGQIGLDEKHGFATALHTHNTSGIIHIESPVERDFTLGQFFTEWNVRLDARHVGSRGGDIGETLTVYVDGVRRAGDPASIRLRDLDDIDLVVAPAGVPTHPQPAFAWPSNYH
ncbi:hypothetical protein GCM10025867_41060 [Frondihabitans sucicola]|uniref:Glycosyl hydrolase family 98 putative carbohydrate-binding module domain-containing protein n=1 Tax=Frondihabitans sucicola TaxID=1268041 RepID=A0ABN6Y3F5_9MICO|nr:hypothetical protein [Frondihabitans sucicola]BDZ51865.1 hypothetical protein GCM10025867_41060 [Frondihabitans sucicola]